MDRAKLKDILFTICAVIFLFMIAGAAFFEHKIYINDKWYEYEAICYQNKDALILTNERTIYIAVLKELDTVKEIH